MIGKFSKECERCPRALQLFMKERKFIVTTEGVIFRSSKPNWKSNKGNWKFWSPDCDFASNYL